MQMIQNATRIASFFLLSLVYLIERTLIKEPLQIFKYTHFVIDAIEIIQATLFYNECFWEKSIILNIVLRFKILISMY